MARSRVSNATVSKPTAKAAPSTPIATRQPVLASLQTSPEPPYNDIEVIIDTAPESPGERLARVEGQLAKLQADMDQQTVVHSKRTSRDEPFAMTDEYSASPVSPPRKRVRFASIPEVHTSSHMGDDPQDDIHTGRVYHKMSDYLVLRNGNQDTATFRSWFERAERYLSLQKGRISVFEYGRKRKSMEMDLPPLPEIWRMILFLHGLPNEIKQGFIWEEEPPYSIYEAVLLAQRFERTVEATARFSSTAAHQDATSDRTGHSSQASSEVQHLTPSGHPPVTPSSSTRARPNHPAEAADSLCCCADSAIPHSKKECWGQHPHSLRPRPDNVEQLRALLAAEQRGVNKR